MDPIADLLSTIKNGYLANKAEVAVPFSQQKEAVAKVLADNQFIVSHSTQGKTPQKKQLLIKLHYKAHGQPAIRQIKRVSKPSQRHYVKVGRIPVVRSGFGISIISTSKGVMSNRQARKAKLGGEIICEVY